jgi:hypothetical protein
MIHICIKYLVADATLFEFVFHIYIGVGKSTLNKNYFCWGVS